MTVPSITPLRTKALVLELLAAVCLVRGGHDIILSAFDNFKEVCRLLLSDIIGAFTYMNLSGSESDNPCSRPLLVTSTSAFGVIMSVLQFLCLKDSHTRCIPSSLKICPPHECVRVQAVLLYEQRG